MRFNKTIMAGLGPFLVLSVAISSAPAAAPAPHVRIMRVPEGGVQPQAMVDANGTVHLIYLHGNPQRSDIFYIRSTDGGDTFSRPLRVNSQPGSAIALGTVRGAHLAVGREGRVHVAWMGSAQAEPKARRNETPMLYARLSDDRTSFEPQQNLIREHAGLDGGGSIAADNAGNVYVAWHAPIVKGAGEQRRRVWIVHSSDDGKSFGGERAATDATTGACGCCGMRLFAAPDGSLYGMYRTADQVIHRDMNLLTFAKDSQSATVRELGAMNASTCIMSTGAFAGSDKAVIAAWEANGQIYWTDVNHSPLDAHAVAGRGNNRKHPSLAINSAGQILLAWTEGTAWNKGGRVASQIFGASGAPQSEPEHAENLPVWGSPASFARADNSFVIVY